MNINLNLEELTELNRIRGLLLSPDFESQVLGFEMFKNSILFKNKIYDLSYETKGGKQIPLSWYIRKAESIIVNKASNSSDINSISVTENFPQLIIPIIDSVLLCESRFTSRVTFNTDKHIIMKNYTPDSILTKYTSETQN